MAGGGLGCEATHVMPRAAKDRDHTSTAVSKGKYGSIFAADEPASVYLGARWGCARVRSLESQLGPRTQHTVLWRTRGVCVARTCSSVHTRAWSGARNGIVFNFRGEGSGLQLGLTVPDVLRLDAVSTFHPGESGPCLGVEGPGLRLEVVQDLEQRVLAEPLGLEQRASAAVVA